MPVSLIMESHEQLERELAAKDAHADEIYKASVELAAMLEDKLAAAREQVSSRNKRLADMARELEQERQDRKQADLDTIRALGERNDARAALAKLKATLSEPAEVELAMIRGHIAIPDRVEFDGIRETKNQTETDDDQL